MSVLTLTAVFTHLAVLLCILVRALHLAATEGPQCRTSGSVAGDDPSHLRTAAADEWQQMVAERLGGGARPTRRPDAQLPQWCWAWHGHCWPLMPLMRQPGIPADRATACHMPQPKRQEEEKKAQPCGVGHGHDDGPLVVLCHQPVGKEYPRKACLQGLLAQSRRGCKNNGGFVAQIAWTAVVLLLPSHTPLPPQSPNKHPIQQNRKHLTAEPRA